MESAGESENHWFSPLEPSKSQNSVLIAVYAKYIKEIEDYDAEQCEKSEKSPNIARQAFISLYT